MRSIICYGDSNTYGYDSRLGSGPRFPEEIRWTGRLNADTDAVIENWGLNGRKIPHTDRQFACFEELLERHLKSQETELWIMLGTNDLLEHPDWRAEQVAERMETFLRRIWQSTNGQGKQLRERLRVALIVPPVMQKGPWAESEAVCLESARLGECYGTLAKEYGIVCVRADQWELPRLYDRVHLSEEGHRIFAENLKRELSLAGS